MLKIYEEGIIRQIWQKKMLTNGKSVKREYESSL